MRAGAGPLAPPDAEIAREIARLRRADVNYTVGGVGADGVRGLLSSITANYSMFIRHDLVSLLAKPLPEP